MLISRLAEKKYRTITCVIVGGLSLPIPRASGVTRESRDNGNLRIKAVFAQDCVDTKG